MTMSIKSTDQLFDKNDIPENTFPATSFIFSVRFLTSMILFLGYCFQYMLKINISIAIVCMVNNTAIDSQSWSVSKSTTRDYGISQNISKMDSVEVSNVGCASPSLVHKNSIDGEFLWSKQIQGFILSAYFYGYILTQIIGGWISFKFGGRNVIAVSMFLSGLFTILTPVCSKWSWIALAINRLIVGATHGVFWPSVSSIWSCWAPPSERSMLAGFANSGSWVGNIIGLPLAGYLCINGFNSGWPSIFYLYGALCAAWSIVFFFICSDNPETHRFISVAERNFIVQELSKVRANNKKRTPWIKFFLSKACWAIYVAHFCSNFGIYLFLTSLPTFLKDVLKFDIKSNGLLSALPYVFACALNILSSLCSDKIIQSRKLSRRNTRKIFGSIGLFLPFLAIIGLSFVTCQHPIIGIVLLIIGIAFSACCWGGGHLVNINDVAGPFSGILFGISNTIATLAGIIAPYIVGVITAHRQTQNEWRIVFYIVSAITLFGGIFWAIFCDGDLQPWATQSNKEKKNESTTKKDSEQITRF